ncbi:MAG TPA: sigma 54-interacting transcriptional regulator [Holophaga sp.]|nr:sigma 54-interacting transcriptional regulator [Holophaga sp.]
MPRFLRILALALLAGALGLWAAPTRHTVLVLYSVSPDVPGFPELGTAIQETLRTQAPYPVDVHTEYTALDRFQDPAYKANLLALYQAKYRGQKVDLVIPVGPSALQFIVDQDFLPGVPVVACYIARSRIEAARIRRPELAGAYPTQNAARTLDLMLAMFPATRRIHVILGASTYEREQAARGRELFKAFEGRVVIDYWNDLTLEAMEARLAALPDDELALFGSLLQDAGGRIFTTNEGVNRVARASRRPVFGVIGEDLGEGITGGVLLDMARSGRAAAKLGVEILGGARASSLPLRDDEGATPRFDWRELKRFGIRARTLPPGSEVRFREVGMWEMYWKEIGAGLAIIALETLLVAGLVIQLRQRRRTERALAATEARYRTVADFTHDWEFWQRPDGSFAYVSPACQRISGHAPHAFMEDPDLLGRLVHPEDQAAWAAFQAEALAGREEASFEFRLQGPEGRVLWVEQASNPVPHGGFRGSLRDITDRKEADLALKTALAEIGSLKDRLEAENTYYREKIQFVEPSSELLGQSDSMKYLLYRIRQVAPSETTVLIQGETGTGKELVADSVHRLSLRADRPLIKMNCAALPPGVAESELFGHERGAFTGAGSQRKGRFELAEGGTLFLDEIGELSAEVQAKLLRVLQDGTFQRVGGDRTLKVDVRVIAATNRDLDQEVAQGRFREDLWYRLNVFPITVPPLRNRPDDVPILAQAFVERFCSKLGRPVLRIPTAVVQGLQAYPWPGNVRELQNVLERAVLVSEGEVLRLAEPLVVSPRSLDRGGARQARLSLKEMERRHIQAILEETGWKIEGQGGAAEILDVRPSTLRDLMTRLGVARNRPA